MLHLGSPGEQQLDMLPGNVTGIPLGFQYHPFCFIDWKEEAHIQKQVALRSAERTTELQVALVNGLQLYAHFYINLLPAGQEE